MTAYTAPNFLDMLAYKRPQNSRSQKKFCRRFLEPVFGQPDAHGNYIKIVGKDPKIAFMSHHDTVHRNDGKQVLTIKGDMVYSAGNDCLGADCTTGVYIMLRMIEAKIPGVYVVHAAEEVGCLGSSALVRDYPTWLRGINFAISFDRMGYNSIITHQVGMRTCSDEFANSLAYILDMDLEADPTGVYTDSNEYRDHVAECTNLSVGYFRQHTKDESQDLNFLEQLIQSLVEADWSKLVCVRKPGSVEYEYTGKKNRSMAWDSWDDDSSYYNASSAYINDAQLQDLQSVIMRYPAQVAEVLESYGYSYDGLLDDCVSLQERSLRKHN